MNKIIAKINELLEHKDSILIAIDGRCASGKTTLANELAKIYDLNIIHCDDFFLPLDLRTKSRLEIPGNNIHYERLLEEVIIPITNSKPISYHIYDCKLNKETKLISLTSKRINIIEGSYSMNPNLIKYYDLKIFINVDSTTQLTRLKTRDINKYDDFINKWIPLEEKYISYYDIINKADIIL